jgi:single-strand DNA-binding protein
MNNITVAGQLGKDAELKQVGQEQVLSFSVADSQGRDKPSIWWNCQLWGRRATSLQQYLVKGASVTITGQVTQREYTDKTGQKKIAQDVRVNDVCLQGSKREPAQEQKQTKPAPKEFDDDSPIPF